MKSSKGNSLYEVLKSASRPAGADDGAATEAPAAAPAEAVGTLQERLAAYKAAKLAEATSGIPEAAAVEPAPVKAPAATLVLEPDPTPIPAPAPARVYHAPPAPVAPPPPAPAPVASAAAETTAIAPVAKGPGERVLRLTYNTALFGGMVVAGLLFVAYAVGLHVGKSHVAAESTAVVPLRAPVAPVAAPLPAPPAPPPVAPSPSKEYTLRLTEWRMVTSKERLDAMSQSEELKKALERAGYRGLEKAPITRRGEPYLALYMEKFTDLGAPAAKSKLSGVKAFRYKNTTPFEKAVFEELPGVR